MDGVLEALAMSNMDRLRWLVLSRFGCPPFSQEALSAKDEDYIFCGLNMVLDKMAKERLSNAGEQNPAFDLRRFETLRGGGA